MVSINNKKLLKVNKDKIKEIQIPCGIYLLIVIKMLKGEIEQDLIKGMF